MLELQTYFTAPADDLTIVDGTLGQFIFQGWHKKQSDADIRIALFSVADYRNNPHISEKSSSSAFHVREQLYGLTKGQISRKIIDLGELKIGKTRRDTYFALAFIFCELHKKKIVPIFFGSDDSMIYSIYQYFTQIGDPLNHLHIDYMFDNQHEELNIVNQDCYFHKIQTDFKQNVQELTILGTQSYYCDLEPFFSETNSLIINHRLGLLRAELFESEAFFRNSDSVSFDLNAIRMSDNPANYLGMPNGLYAEEACQLAWYAGYSERVSLFGLFNYFSEYDNRKAGAKLVAQIIWHFFDGCSKRLGEDPHFSIDQFLQLHVNVESIRQELVFCKSILSNRYWLKLPTINEGKGDKFLAVSKPEYLNAVNNLISDRIYFYLTQQ
ncbi:MAG: hypothetical protein PHU27_05410 [Salinivirgaceae bacterium]|nr:hypothetical protein [Salinivirgaceae bacterium]MDD4746122.1 hypothetical protein [Salinivirgaceae bacterium]MDY0279846.1 hypothetical protein [Salinivirgaceae bacterium]